MEVFQENYAKMYNFILSKKELKFTMTNVLLPHGAVKYFYEQFKKFNKTNTNFNTRQEIRAHFPKLLKKLDLSCLNFLIISKEDKLSFKSLYNHFEDDHESKNQIIDIVIELLISSSVYNSMKVLQESIKISNDLNNEDKEFISILLSKFETLVKNKNLTTLEDLVKYVCDYLSKHPDIILRFSDDFGNMVRPLIESYIGKIEKPLDEMILEVINIIPEEQIKEFERWLEVINKPKDFTVIPELYVMIKKLIEHENFNLQLLLPSYIINFLLNENNINNIYIIIYLCIESVMLVGKNTRLGIINDFASMYNLPEFNPNISQKEQMIILQQLFINIKNSDNLMETLSSYYNEKGRGYLDVILKQINRKYNIVYSSDYIESLVKVLMNELLQES